MVFEIPDCPWHATRWDTSDRSRFVAHSNWPSRATAHPGSNSARAPYSTPCAASARPTCNTENFHHEFQKQCRSSRLWNKNEIKKFQSQEGTWEILLRFYFTQQYFAGIVEYNIPVVYCTFVAQRDKLKWSCVTRQILDWRANKIFERDQRELLISNLNHFRFYGRREEMLSRVSLLDRYRDTTNEFSSVSYNFISI